MYNSCTTLSLCFDISNASRFSCFSGSTICVSFYFLQDSEKRQQRRENELVNNELKIANEEFIKVGLYTQTE